MTFRTWITLGLAVGLAVAYRSLLAWDPGRELSEESAALFVPSNTSPHFIGALSALFLYMRIDRIRGAAARGAPAPWGAALLLPAVAVHAWGLYTGAPDLLLLALIPTLLGLAALLYGGEMVRVLLLPVLFLLFAYPVPAAVANQQVYLFQHATAVLSTWVLNAIGVPAVVEGDMIYTRGRIFEVIETCSGLRITETLFASAFAYGELMCRRRLHKLVIVALAPLLGFLLNSVRVLMIIFSPTSDSASDHTLQGLAVIVVGVFSFALIERALEALAPSRGARRPLRPVREAGPTAARIGSAVAVLGVGAMAGVSLGLEPWQPGAEPRWRVTLPIELDGWRARKLDNDETFLGSVYFSRDLHRRYQRDGVDVDVFVGKDDLLQRDRSMLSPKTALPGAGWRAAGHRRVERPWTPEPVREILAVRRGQHALVYHWREGTLGPAREALRAVAALDRSPLRREGEARVYRVSTPVGRATPPELAAARARLDFFGAALREGVELR